MVCHVVLGAELRHYVLWLLVNRRTLGWSTTQWETKAQEMLRGKSRQHTPLKHPPPHLSPKHTHLVFILPNDNILKNPFNYISIHLLYLVAHFLSNTQTHTQAQILIHFLLWQPPSFSCLWWKHGGPVGPKDAVKSFTAAVMYRCCSELMLFCTDSTAVLNCPVKGSSILKPQLHTNLLWLGWASVPSLDQACTFRVSGTVLLILIVLSYMNRFLISILRCLLTLIGMC